MGDGSERTLLKSERNAHYSYNNQGMILIALTHLKFEDLYSCKYKSKEIALAAEENKFTIMNVAINPQKSEIKKEGDSIALTCMMGSSFSSANPNEPIQYLWNTGEPKKQIYVKQEGNYSVEAIDKYECKSPVAKSKISILYKSTIQPKVSGPTKLKPGEKWNLIFKKKVGYLYQWKFIFNH